LDRPALAKVFLTCGLRRPKLDIAKLDRLSREAHFLLGLEKAGVDFVAAVLPSANRFTVGIMASVAGEEQRLISRRTKEACVDAPSGARRIFGQLLRGIGCCHVSGLCCGGSQAAGPYGSSWIRSTSLKRARSALPSPGSPDPASPTFAPYLSFDLLTPSTASHPPTAYAATAGAR